MNESDAHKHIDRALVKAIDTPKNIMENSLLLLDKIMFLSKNGNENTFSDIGVSLEMIHSSFFAGKYNVLINLGDLNDSALKETYKSFVNEKESIFLKEYNDIKKIINSKLDE